MNYYVYMMEAGGYVKIGVSKNPESRRESMQTGNPFRIDIVARFPFSSKAEAYNYEALLHRKLKPYHFRREWFHKNCIGLATRKVVRGHSTIPKNTLRKMRMEKDDRWDFEKEYEEMPDKTELAIVFEANKRI